MIATSWSRDGGTQTCIVVGTSPAPIVAQAATPLSMNSAACRFVWTSPTQWPSPPSASPSPLARDRAPLSLAAGRPAGACDVQENLPHQDGFRTPAAAAARFADAATGDDEAGGVEDREHAQPRADPPPRTPAGAQGPAPGERANDDNDVELEDRDVEPGPPRPRRAQISKDSMTQTKWPGDAYARKAFLPPNGAYEYKIQGTDRRYGNLRHTLAYRIGKAPPKKTRGRARGALHAHANQRASVRLLPLHPTPCDR